MKFLFKTILFSYNTPVYYKIHQVAKDHYYAEPLEETRKPFNFRKHEQMWIGEGSSSQYHAEELGQKIDRIRSLAK